MLDGVTRLWSDPRVQPGDAKPVYFSLHPPLERAAQGFPRVAHPRRVPVRHCFRAIDSYASPWRARPTQNRFTEQSTRLKRSPHWIEHGRLVHSKHKISSLAPAIDRDLRAGYPELGGDPSASELRLSDDSLRTKERERPRGGIRLLFGIAGERLRSRVRARVLITHDHMGGRSERDRQILPAEKRRRPVNDRELIAPALGRDRRAAEPKSLRRIADQIRQLNRGVKG